MGSITLAPHDTALLHLLADAPSSSDHLAEIVEDPRPELTDQLAAFEENGLLWKQADETYALTESGSRVLAVPADHGVDSRIDAPRRVCQAITKQDLRPDREAAVFDAVAFLQYWGEATESELIDGIYSETPAGYETADKWWQSFMQGTLAGLPDIEPPTADRTVWRYTGTHETEEPTEDGRDPFAGPTTSYGSVKHALEALDLSSDQHTAVHTVFATLRTALRSPRPSSNRMSTIRRPPEMRLQTSGSSGSRSSSEKFQESGGSMNRPGTTPVTRSTTLAPARDRKSTTGQQRLTTRRPPGSWGRTMPARSASNPTTGARISKRVRRGYQDGRFPSVSKHSQRKRRAEQR